MTPTGELDEFALAGGLLMACSLLMILYRVRGGWSASLGVLYVVSLVLFHGICEFNLWLFPRGLLYRFQGDVDFQWSGTTILVAAAGIFSFAIAYCLGRPKVIVGQEASPASRSFEWLSQINPIFLTLWMLCGGIYRMGVNNLFEGLGPIAYVLSALLFYVNIPLMALMALWLSAQHSLGQLATRTYVLGMLLLVLTFSLLGGNRQEVFIAILSTFVLLHKFRIKRVSPSVLAVCSLTLMTLFLALTCVRSAVGRAELLASTPLERLQLIAEGLGTAFSTDRWQETEDTLAIDLGYRFDGNMFLSKLVTLEANSPSESWDLEPIRISLEQMIPSFLWASKHERMYGNVKGYMYWGRNLPEVDYLETSLAEFYACGGLTPMLFGMFVTGLVVARLETFFALGIERSFSAASQPSLILGIGLVCMATGLAFVEVGLQYWPLSARNALILWVVLRSASSIR